MKFITIIFCLLLTAAAAFAQSSEKVLATANNQTFTIKDLAPEVREMYEKLPMKLAEYRRSLLERQIADVLFESEAAAKKVSIEKLIETEVNNKVPAPNVQEIQRVYEANQAALGGKTLDEVRPQIAAFLRRAPEQKTLNEYLASLKAKYKVTFGKDAGAANLKPFDALATVGGKPISVEGFEAANKQSLYEIEADAYDAMSNALEETVLSALISTEAKARNIEPSDLIAAEITDKMRDYTDEERGALQSDLRKRLFRKYNAKINLTEPAPFAQTISIDDQPTRGRADAPVTVVMFTDFQCPACAATHPVLKKVLAEYADKIRFVVRDFPLVNVHENAFRAALAVNAARAQGKFFEYAELLYKNQNALDADSLRKYALDAGLNQKRFDLDLESEKTAADVRRDLADGKTYGITGTPTIFVNGVKVRTLSADAFRRAIEKALKISN